MKTLIAWFMATVTRLWWVTRNDNCPTPVDAIEEPKEPFVAPYKPSRKTNTRIEEDKTQAHYYLGDLLDNLESYFNDLEYLRRGDPEGAANFEKFGCSLCDSDRMLSTDLEPFFFDRLPAQGCFYYGGTRKEDKAIIPVKFVYFQKQRQPVNVQATNGIIYTVAGVWEIKERHLFQVHLAVFPDRSIKVLKEISPRQHVVGKGSRKNGGQGKSTIIRMEWGYSSYVREIVSDYNRREKTNLGVDEYFSRFFTTLVNSVLRSEMDMNVRVKKCSSVATFSINMLRTPYFFADREKTVNENGNTQKILHIVKPHERTMRNGEKRTIKAHWRGLRRFTWNGYDVSIGMPGGHYAPLVNFAGEAWNEADAQREGKTGLIDSVEAATIIDRAVTAKH